MGDNPVWNLTDDLLPTPAWTETGRRCAPCQLRPSASLSEPTFHSCSILQGGVKQKNEVIYDAILHEIMKYSGSFILCSFIHEFRSLNFEAHNLVKHALQLGVGHYVLVRPIFYYFRDALYLRWTLIMDPNHFRKNKTLIHHCKHCDDSIKLHMIVFFLCSRSTL